MDQAKLELLRYNLVNQRLPNHQAAVLQQRAVLQPQQPVQRVQQLEQRTERLPDLLAQQLGTLVQLAIPTRLEQQTVINETGWWRKT